MTRDESVSYYVSFSLNYFVSSFSPLSFYTPSLFFYTFLFSLSLNIHLNDGSFRLNRYNIKGPSLEMCLPQTYRDLYVINIVL